MEPQFSPLTPYQTEDSLPPPVYGVVEHRPDVDASLIAAEELGLPKSFVTSDISHSYGQKKYHKASKAPSNVQPKTWTVPPGAKLVGYNMQMIAGYIPATYLPKNKRKKSRDGWNSQKLEGGYANYRNGYNSDSKKSGLANGTYRNAQDVLVDHGDKRIGYNSSLKEPGSLAGVFRDTQEVLMNRSGRRNDSSGLKEQEPVDGVYPVTQDGVLVNHSNKQADWVEKDATGNELRLDGSRFFEKRQDSSRTSDTTVGTIDLDGVLWPAVVAGPEHEEEKEEEEGEENNRDSGSSVVTSTLGTRTLVTPQSELYLTFTQRSINITPALSSSYRLYMGEKPAHVSATADPVNEPKVIDGSMVNPILNTPPIFDSSAASFGLPQAGRRDLQVLMPTLPPGDFEVQKEGTPGTLSAQQPTITAVAPQPAAVAVVPQAAPVGPQPPAVAVVPQSSVEPMIPQPSLTPAVPQLSVAPPQQPQQREIIFPQEPVSVKHAEAPNNGFMIQVSGGGEKKTAPHQPVIPGHLLEVTDRTIETGMNNNARVDLRPAGTTIPILEQPSETESALPAQAQIPIFKATTSVNPQISASLVPTVVTPMMTTSAADSAEVANEEKIRNREGSLQPEQTTSTNEAAEQVIQEPRNAKQSPNIPETKDKGDVADTSVAQDVRKPDHDHNSRNLEDESRPREELHERLPEEDKDRDERPGRQEFGRARGSESEEREDGRGGGERGNFRGGDDHGTRSGEEEDEETPRADEDDNGDGPERADDTPPIFPEQIPSFQEWLSSLPIQPGFPFGPGDNRGRGSGRQSFPGRMPIPFPGQFGGKFGGGRGQGREWARRHPNEDSGERRPTREYEKEDDEAEERSRRGDDKQRFIGRRTVPYQL